jgi:MFS family permease
VGRIRSNVRLFYVYIFLNRLEMWLPVTVLLVQDRGFSLAQYTIADAMWYVSTLIFEVPTGVVTDRYGKKISLVIALLLQSISLFILAFGYSFLSIVVSYVLWGCGSSFETGTHDALIYDSLKQISREGDYRRVMGRVQTLAIFAGALGSIMAGYLGRINLALPILLTASIALLTCPLVLLFTEPDVSDLREPSHLLHIKESIHYVSHHRPVALLIFYSAIMMTGVWGLHDFYQPLLRSFQVPVERIGLLYLFFRLCGVMGAYLSDPLYKIAGRILVYLIPFCFVISVLGMGFLVTPWVMSFIFLIYFIEGLYYPILNDLLNQNLPSGKRATIISLGSVLACLMGCAAYPVLGRIADVFSLQTTFRVLGAGVLVTMSVVIALLRWGDFPSGPSRPLGGVGQKIGGTG